MVEMHQKWPKSIKNGWYQSKMDEINQKRLKSTKKWIDFVTFDPLMNQYYCHFLLSLVVF